MYVHHLLHVDMGTHTNVSVLMQGRWWHRAGLCAGAVACVSTLDRHTISVTTMLIEARIEDLSTSTATVRPAAVTAWPCTWPEPTTPGDTPSRSKII